MIPELDKATAQWCKATNQLQREGRNGRVSRQTKDAFEAACERRRAAREQIQPIDWSV